MQNRRISGLHDDDEDRDLTRFLPSISTLRASVPLRAGQWTFVGPAKAAVCLTMFEISINPVQVITVLRGIGVARCINFAKHFVFPGLLVMQALPGYRWSFLSSHDLPESSPRIRTFAMWRKFQVKRKSHPSTAAAAIWTASRPAFAGIAPGTTSSLATPSILRSTGKSETS